MRDLINQVAAHARASYLRMAQLEAELTEVRKMQRDRESEYTRLQQQTVACRAMLRSVRDDLPSGEARDALDQLMVRLAEPGEPLEDEDPPWHDDDELGLPEDDGPSWGATDGLPKIGWDFWRR